MNVCTHAHVRANDQVIRATSPHTAPVGGPCHPHGAATSMGLGGSVGLRRRWRWWWCWWNWNTHTYCQCRGRGKGGWSARVDCTLLSHTHIWNVCTHLALCIQESVRSCSGSAPAPRTSAAGKQTARSPVWLEYPAPGTHPRSECQHSCCHGNTGKVTEIARLSNQRSEVELMEMVVRGCDKLDMRLKRHSTHFIKEDYSSQAGLLSVMLAVTEGYLTWGKKT